MTPGRAAVAAVLPVLVDAIMRRFERKRIKNPTSVILRLEPGTAPSAAPRQTTERARRMNPVSSPPPLPPSSTLPLLH